MSIFSARTLRHDLCIKDLEKLGAKIVDFKGIMTLATFKLDRVTIAYMYWHKKNGDYFVERILPYYMPVGDFKQEETIVESMEKDLNQFKNAANSKNFTKFVEIDSKIMKLVRIFEDLYLYYNIDKENVEKLDKAIKNVYEIIFEIQKNSERVIFDKEPDILNSNFKIDEIY